MSNDRKQRIISIMEAENMNATQFAEAIGIQRAAMSHIMNERNKPSADVLAKILERFETINPSWLLSGKGNMRNDVATTSSGYAARASNEPDLFFQHDTKKSLEESSIETPSETDIRAEIHFTDKIFKGEEVDESENINKNTEKEVVTYKERPVKTIDKLLIFYSDHTYETFIPEKHSTE